VTGDVLLSTPSSSLTSATSLIVVTTFYTASLEQPLEKALIKRDATHQVILVPYNQLNAFLLNPSSVIPEHTTARLLVLLRVEDFVRLELLEHSKNPAGDASHCLSALRQREAEFLEIIGRMQQFRVTVMICPAGRGAYDSTFLSSAIRVTEHKIAAKLKSQQKHLVLNWSDFEKFAPTGDLFNPAGDRLGHVPFSPEGLTALAEFFVEKRDQMPTVTLASASADSNTADFERFLASLDVGLAVAPMTLETEEASIGLMRHTTHFITHPGDKPSPGRPLALASAAPAGEAWSLTVNDRFGYYGTSGAVVFGVDTNIMRIAFLFLTCPVLGRQVEHAMFHWLAGLAELRNAEFIQIPVLSGRDNKVLSQLLQKLGADAVPDSASATQSNGTSTHFILRVPGLKDAVKRLAPNPAALSTIITNMNHREITHAH
jgi:hypothetical protein